MSTVVKILYIEDDFANKVLVRKIIKNKGYELYEAEDGLSGIELAEEVHPDLILLDMSMPGIDGYEVTRRLKNMENVADIPIIAVTANAMEGDKEKCLEAGCRGYISKPIDISSFMLDIETYLGENA